jgi:hypothetical protein
MKKLLRIAATLVALSVMQCADAGTFGASIDTYEGYIAPCIYDIVGSIAVRVDVPSRLLAQVNSTLSPTSNNLSGIYYITLRKDTTVIAINVGSTYFGTYGSSMILTSSSILSDVNTGANNFTVPPGDYVLEFIVSPNGLCSGLGPYVYKDMLLSAALDDIFVNGFNATLNSGSRNRTLVQHPNGSDYPAIRYS